jgi:hypothetical protein
VRLTGRTGPGGNSALRSVRVLLLIDPEMRQTRPSVHVWKTRGYTPGCVFPLAGVPLESSFGASRLLLQSNKHQIVLHIRAAPLDGFPVQTCPHVLF